MIRFRYITALMLLVISLVLTGGLNATVSALFLNGPSSACCDSDAAGQTIPDEAPCSEPGCQCITCLSFVLQTYSRRPTNNGFLTDASVAPLFKAAPPEYVKTIDYPPELS